MILVPLTNRAEIKNAFDLFRKNMSNNGQSMRREIGFPGGHMDADIKWYPDLRYWVAFKKNLNNRYWCAYGTDDPLKNNSLKIVVEINIPYEGMNRRVAGVFAKDDAGRIYLTHSGKIGGGRKGIGKTAFTENYSGKRVALIWCFEAEKEGHVDETESFLIGDLKAKNLQYQISTFVKQTEHIKKISGENLSSSTDDTTNVYSPEPMGPRKKYSITQEIQAECNHGIVVEELYQALIKRGIEVGKDRYRDLFIKDTKGNMKILFEVKVDDSLSNIYQAIGQLMYHGTSPKHVPKKVFVIQGSLNQNTLNILRQLGITVLFYKLQDNIVKFKDLKRLLPCQVSPYQSISS